MLRPAKSPEEIPVEIIENIHHILTEYSRQKSTHHTDPRSRASAGAPQAPPGSLFIAVISRPVLPNADYIIIDGQRKSKSRKVKNDSGSVKT